MRNKALIMFILLFVLTVSIFANNNENYQINFSELQNNRTQYILTNYKQQKLFCTHYEPQISLSSKSKTDTSRIKWEYLGPFIGVVAIANASIYYMFKDAYWNEEKTKFHTFNDWNTADMNIDKLGHVYAGILLSKTSYKILRATNVPETQSVIFSTLSSIFFQTQIEVHDAFYKKWGWSWWDFGGNVLGAIYPHLQNYFKPLQAINLKWSYHPSPAYKNGWYEHWIKDYEGFTYYLSFDINHLLPEKFEKFWPDWLNIAVAYGVDKVKLGRNIWNSAGKPLGDREWYIALDYSLVKIFKPKSKFLRELLDLLDSFHFPAPAVRFSPSTIWYGIYF